MNDNSKPITLVYCIYYKVMKTILNPKAILKLSGNRTLLIQSSTSYAKIQVPKMIH